MTQASAPYDLDPRYPPRYQVLMQTDHELPPDLLWQALARTLALEPRQAQVLALSVLRHETVPYGVYSREIAEAKALQLNQAMISHGRVLQTRIVPCDGPHAAVVSHLP